MLSRWRTLRDLPHQERSIWEESPHDECGVFGIYAPELDVSRLTFFALFALQHRGQESAGIAVTDGARLDVHKDMGLVSQVFQEEMLQSLPGKLAIGHVRYSTTGASSMRNAQPFARTRNGSFIALAHNGNLVNIDSLKNGLEQNGHVFESTSDTEVIAALLAEHPSHDIREALREVIPRLRGAFSAVLLTKDEVIGFRDPYGVRPLVLGEVEGRYCLASETSGLDIIGAKLVREIEPGEICVLTETGYEIEQVVARKQEALCVFEFIYFARPDSVMKGQTLYAARSRMGEELAAESPVEADLVIPVPDTGNSAAIGYAARSGITYGEALIKNRYIGRTFIDPDDQVRRLGIRMKFNPLTSALKDKRLVVVDDSIVRGNTTRALVQVLFDAGAKEVHLRISSPPIIYPCFYGIDMADEDELAAAHRSVEEMREHVGATSLHYLSLDGMQWATRLPEGSVCRACFTRAYPTPVPANGSGSKLRFESAATSR